MFKNKSIRRWLIIGAVVIVVLLAVRSFSSARAGTVAQVTNEKVVALTVSETIGASGTLQAQPFAALNWKTNGVVAGVYVKPGQLVKSGDKLVSLVVSSAPANIISAQADLVNAQSDLDTVMNSTMSLAKAEQDLADAKQAVEDAQKDVTKLDYRRASDDLINQTEDEIALAKQQVSRAESYYNLFRSKPDGDSQKAQAELNLINARTNRDQKIATLNWYLGTPSDLDATKYRAALAVAQAQEADAQREVDRLKDGPAPEDIRAAQARVDAAQATVNSLFIIAPFDGQVLAVENVAGDMVNTGDVSVYVADMNHLYVEAQVDESDVANVKLRQTVDVTLDALTGVTLTGKVTAINPVGQVISGLVKYSVRIDLDQVKDQIFTPLSTTADVTIHVTDAVSSLAVPITTIQNDARGEFVMIVQNDGSVKRVDVVSGTIVGDLVVVSGDLQKGDVVQVNNGSSFNAPNPFGGG